MKAGFEIIEHTADIGIRVWGESCKDVFKEAAAGMLNIIVDTHAVRCREKRIIKVEAEQIEELLLLWLREVLFLVEQAGMVFSKFQVKKDNFAYKNARKYVFYCSLEGEKVDPERHNICREVKAVTRHGLYIKRSPYLWEARVYFDV